MSLHGFASELSHPLFVGVSVCVCLHSLAFELSYSLFVGDGACPSRCTNLSAFTNTSADNPSIVGSASHCNRSSPLHNGAKCDSSSPKFSANLKSIPHYHQIQTVPLSCKNPQHYQIVNQRHIAALRQRNQRLYPPF